VTRTERALSVWVRLARAYQAVLRSARAAVAPDCTLPQFDVLSQLARREAAGSRCTAGDLSRMLLVTAGNVTGLVRRLVSQGWVRRTVDPADRRRAWLELTPSGRAVWRRLRERHAQALADTLSGLSPVVANRLRADLVALRASTRGPAAGEEGAA